MATRKFRLKTMAFMDGALREPGYEFFLQDGQRGPHKSIRLRADRLKDGGVILGERKDIPLYEEVH